MISDLKIDRAQENLYCLENDANSLKVFSLGENRGYYKSIPLAKNGVCSFDFVNDSILLCYPILNTCFKNNMLAFTQDLSGNLIKECPLYSGLDDGPVYKGEIIAHQVTDGYIYMPYPKDTLFLIDKDMNSKPLLAIQRTKRDDVFVNYKILFPDSKKFIFSVITNVIKNDGQGSLVLFPDKEMYFEIDLVQKTTRRVANKDFKNLTFFQRGTCVLTTADSQQPNQLSATIFSR